MARESAERAIRLHDGAESRRRLARVENMACRLLFGDEPTRERARAQYEAAGRLDPYDPFLQIELAAFLSDTADPAGARRAAERALRLEPEAAAPRLLLAGVSLQVPDPDGAERAEAWLEEALDRSQRWSGQVDGDYGAKLLRVEESAVARLRAGIEHARSAPLPATGDAP